MDIVRDENGLRIILYPYKINIKEVKTKEGKNYQYTCNLPPLLCSFLRVSKNIKEPNLLFYEYKNNIYITDVFTYDEVFFNFDEDTLKRTNYDIWSNMEQKKLTTAYNVNNTSFRLTLPNKMFKDKIDVSKDNYLIYYVDTLEKDLLNNVGVIKLSIKQV